MAELGIHIEGLAELHAGLDRMSRDVDRATVAALKATQNIAKGSVRAQMRGRPRWDHRGMSERTGEAVKLGLSPHHQPRAGGPGRLTGTLAKGVGGVRKPRKTPQGFAGGVGVGGQVRNLYKGRTEGRFPYLKPGIDKATPKFGAVWLKAWNRAVHR
ncbi:hypothetical protein [Kitasatospora sp. GP82]|uniref:hypothetical protein n=1 Tax=Kitasatospora sp. GP82 TaxID=3035089 RepID=UPI00247429BD|nr:hypothetical protein [Kitasatospora sp. GP82]MDH6123447.1 hypothetical protein [Kitasatospora sp. GP82]